MLCCPAPMKSLPRTLILAVAVAAAGWIPLAGRSDSPLDIAALAWDRGDYVTALQTYLKVLDSPDAAAALETIALQTGELFQTTELTTDGATPVFSPDGKYFAYETGTGLTRMTRLHQTANPGKPAAEVQGSSAAFSPDGTKVAYLKVTPSPSLLEAQATVDRAPQAERQQRQAAVTRAIARESQVVVRDLATGAETRIDVGDLRKSALAFATGGAVVFAGASAEEPTQIYIATASGATVLQTNGTGEKAPTAVNSTGTALLYSIRAPGAGGGRGGGGGQGGGGSFGLVALPNGASQRHQRHGPIVLSRRQLADLCRARRHRVPPGGGGREGPVPRVGRAQGIRTHRCACALPGRQPRRLPDDAEGRLGALHRHARRQGRDASHTRDPARPATPFPRLEPAARHDGRGPASPVARLRPQLADTVVNARAAVPQQHRPHDRAGIHVGARAADGKRVLIVSERDGDTVSVERGVYLVDLERKITREALRARVAANLAAEEALRAKGRRLYAPIAANVKKVTEQASVDRVYGYEKALFDFDSKHITRPGNKLASEYLFNKYKSFGYEPEYQWFAGRGALGGQTANVIATLKGTVNPELIYVVSSHYDSVAVGPGADDDTSGTAALLEAARIMANSPQPATIVFASFTGEEAGLLGSREYVRRAVTDKLKLVGALNNDMVGWANDHRLDNTIRYSNAGIRDIQHSAAMQFSNMVTYDALYYKSTDAAAYYEAYGDIVGGIGSYPVLGNPHYHQSHDLLDTINHQLVTEVAKTTAATLMLLASSPSRLTDLKVDTFTGGTAKISWTPSPEKGITGYIVAYGPPTNPEAQTLRVTQPSATVPKVAAGSVISVKAVNAKGLEGWDWARISVR